MAGKQKAEKEEKYTRGANLSRQNWMWLLRMAREDSERREDGRTTSASEVLDGMLTKAREAYELAERRKA